MTTIQTFLRVASLAILAGIGWAAVLLFEAQSRWMLDYQARNGAETWLDHFVSLTDQPETVLRTGALSPAQVDRLIRPHTVLLATRFRLFDAAGRLTFVSDGTATAAPVSDLTAPDPGAAAVLRNRQPRVSIRTSSTPAAPPETFAEVYLPVQQGGSRIGAVAVVIDMTQARSATQAALMTFALALGALMLAALAVPSLHLYRAMRKVQWTNARMQAIHADLEERAMRDRDRAAQQNRLTREVGLLGHLSEWLQSCRSQKELFEMVVSLLTRLLPGCQGSIYVFSNSRDVLDGCAEWNGGAMHPHIHPDDCWGMRRGRTYEYGDAEIQFRCEHVTLDADAPYVCMPLVAHGETVGLLHLQRKHGATVNEFDEQRHLAQVCAEQISMAIANVRLRDELQDQSVRDALTGLFNRRHLNTTLRRCLGRASRSAAQVAVLSIDVDHFKKFNDTYGHDAGDLVLRGVGGVLDGLAQGDEVACRPGGEEFTVVLPGCDVSEALFRAEEIREQVQEINLRYGEKTLPAITVSIGVAMFPGDGANPQDLLRSADEALYAAKDRGRNQVILTSLMHEPQPDAAPADLPAAAAG